MSFIDPIFKLLEWAWDFERFIERHLMKEESPLIEIVQNHPTDDLINLVAKVLPDLRLGGAGMKVDIHSIEDTINSFCSSDDRVLFIATVDGVSVGIFFGSYSNFPFTRNRIASEYFMAVLPQYRKMGIGKLFFGHFKVWAKYRKCEILGLPGNLTAHYDALVKNDDVVQRAV